MREEMMTFSTLSPKTSFMSFVSGSNSAFSSSIFFLSFVSNSQHVHGGEKSDQHVSEIPKSDQTLNPRCLLSQRTSSNTLFHQTPRHRMTPRRPSVPLQASFRPHHQCQDLDALRKTFGTRAVFEDIPKKAPVRCPSNLSGPHAELQTLLSRTLQFLALDQRSSTVETRPVSTAISGRCVIYTWSGVIGRWDYWSMCPYWSQCSRNVLAVFTYNIIQPCQVAVELLELLGGILVDGVNHVQHLNALLAQGLEEG